jgi:hypothetical protein
MVQPGYAWLNIDIGEKAAYPFMLASLQMPRIVPWHSIDKKILIWLLRLFRRLVSPLNILLQRRVGLNRGRGWFIGVWR